MGLFDRVHVSPDDTRFRCSEDHRLDHELQSKDFGSTMGEVYVDGRAIRLAPGGAGDDEAPPPRPLNRRFRCYTSCAACPAFVTPDGDLVEPWVELELEIVDDVIVEVARISASTAAWLEAQPAEAYLRDAVGPLPRGEARELQRRRLLQRGKPG
jgi:hypothetical protein